MDGKLQRRPPAHSSSAFARRRDWLVYPGHKRLTAKRRRPRRTHSVQLAPRPSHDRRFPMLAYLSPRSSCSPRSGSSSPPACLPAHPRRSACANCPFSGHCVRRTVRDRLSRAAAAGPPPAPIAPSTLSRKSGTARTNSPRPNGPRSCLRPPRRTAPVQPHRNRFPRRAAASAADKSRPADAVSLSRSSGRNGNADRRSHPCASAAWWLPIDGASPSTPFPSARFSA